MKKSLFALAAMGAFAGAAQAQSSVTVYGIMDVGYSNSSVRNADRKTNLSGITQGQETDSRLGFRGTEDLGGGTSAFFTLEVQVTPNNGGASTGASVSATTANQGNVLTGNRQTFLGLRQKGIGAVSLGTQYTPIHDSVAATDPGGSNNVIGSIIRPTGGAGAYTNIANQGAQGNHLVRTTNSIKFQSDRFAGFNVNAIYMVNQSNNTQTAAQVTGTTTTINTAVGGSNNYTGYGLSVNYTWQKLLATVAYNSIKQEQTGAGVLGYLTSTTTIPGTESQGTQFNVTINDIYAAAVYDFGILKAYAAYTNRKGTSGLNSNQYLKRSGQQIGVRGFATKTIEGWASIGNGKWQTFGTSEPTSNFNSWQLGSNYWLSKRSNLYAIYGQTVSSGTVSAVGSAGSQMAIGVRHTF